MLLVKIGRCGLAAMIAAASILGASLPLQPAQAGLVTTDQVLERRQARADREHLLALLAREDVRRQLVELGIDPREAERRIDGLTDAEVARIADRLEQSPAGQDVVVAFVLAGAVIFVILVITDSLGYTDVFTFIDPVEE